MTRRVIGALCTLAIIMAAHTPAQPFPLGFSAVGGIGAGYYSMSELNRHIGLIAQKTHVSLDDLSSGVNFRAEGRLWVLNKVALTGGYEHYWGEMSSEGTSAGISYRTPADVYTVGGIIAILRIENAFSLCIGANGCMAKSAFGKNDPGERRLSEFKGDDNGYEAYAEIHTNFIDPVVVGFQLGYRGLKITTLKNRFGHEGTFESGQKYQVDYSGVFFYLTMGIRI